MIIPQSTMLPPRYLPSLNRCEIYIVGKTQMKKPTVWMAVRLKALRLLARQLTKVERECDEVVVLFTRVSNQDNTTGSSLYLTGNR